MKKIIVIAAIALIAGLLVLANHYRSAPEPGDQTFKVSIRGMHCAGCVVDVRKSLFDIPGTKKVRVDAARATATVMGDSTVSENDVLRSIEKRGYKAAIQD